MKRQQSLILLESFTHMGEHSTQEERNPDKKTQLNKSSSGMRNLKNNKNFSVDVREYFHEGKSGTDFKIPIEQNHGKNRRGLSKDQLNSNPEDLNLLFYNFHSSNENLDGKIIEEQEELEDDLILGPTNYEEYINQKSIPLEGSRYHKESSFDRRKQTDQVETTPLPLEEFMSNYKTKRIKQDVGQKTMINWAKNKDRLPTRGINTRGCGRRKNKLA
uniref:Uncharacterized protein n=1 Tax=Euplotes crassus TaxID=5936 RepID=A0A7S3K7F0_EUPCR|mmetsp:Transcript_13538/g.13461  ORF Transcript_13538/g.13461 Transcript_13538/m.13461 type:complete len:217 (+) Transcript_13538:350-1000(+)|eukprot:CAMPEP_0197000472 /NCGR_PEP_ID=MMETSP1380-20130617/5407_1 /TAXON_ID=5936 /ORGANISM="Euplotes crassus, Strain CT5" /LENGTH=216 /DNA_ID=CAMNT_0042417775 /DNA_START=208 /DNA_END=858 /DNA_ORIENTATION=-